MNTDLYSVSGTSPTSLDSTATDCNTTFTFRVRRAPLTGKPGRWINARQQFSTLEAAEHAAHSAANDLAARARCRTELELLAVCEWRE